MPTPSYGMGSVLASSLQWNQPTGHTGQHHQMLNSNTSSRHEYETSAMTWTYCPTLQGRVLSVVMHQVNHPVPIDVLSHLFSLYGVVETIFQSLNQYGRKVLIQYKHGYMADNALRATHGWYLYCTYCQLDIRHADHTELQTLADYSGALFSEINNEADYLSNTAAAMPQDKVSDCCQLVTPPRNDQISGKQTHLGTETQSIRDMLAQIQSKLQTMSENLREDLKHMKRPETKQPAASQPNPSTQEAINISDEMPLYEVYAEEDNSCSIGVCSVLDTSLVNPQDGDGEPDTWPLGRATPEPVLDVYDDETDGCSSEFVDVFASTHEQQIYEQKQHEKCFSKPICSPERPPIDVFSLSNEKKPDNLDCAFELQQQDNESECNFSVLKASNSFVTRCSHLSIEHSMRELRLLWDPGTSTSLHSTVSLVDLLYYFQGHGVKNTETVQWDPEIRPSSSMYCWLQSLTTGAVTGQPLSSFQTPEPATCQTQVTSVSYVWDPGPILLLSKSIWLLLFTEEKEVVALIPQQWSFVFNTMHYCLIFQKCNARSSLSHCHQDPKLTGIAPWLITFNPP